MGRGVRIDAEAAASPVRFAMVKAVEGGTSGAMAMAIQVGADPVTFIKDAFCSCSTKYRTRI